jgi:hypothetical protein
MCRAANIHIFYTQAVPEPSGLGLLTLIQKILARLRILIDKSIEYEIFCFIQKYNLYTILMIIGV